MCSERDPYKILALFVWKFSRLLPVFTICPLTSTIVETGTKKLHCVLQIFAKIDILMVPFFELG